MGFPFINKPFDKWVSDKLNERSSKINTHLNRYTPFIWLSSGAIVCKGGRPANISVSPLAAVYNGCVISNHIDTSIKYPLNNPILGYDLNGKVIKIEGENGLKISPPIIESMEIDTDGENNTLKVATINITIFSLKQLEMFELFFLKPSMTVVMEYGHNNPDTKVQVAAESFIKGKNWKTYVDETSTYFTPDANNYAQNIKSYGEKIKNTKGDYDFWIAKVTNFNVTYDGSENVYKVQLEISSGNELHLWMPIKQQSTSAVNKSNNSNSSQPAKTNDAKAWMEQLCSELMLSDNISQSLQKDALTKYKNEFFNWGITSRESNDKFSKDSYVSFKLILDIMNNCENFKTFDKKINYELIKGAFGDVLPVNSNKDIISTTTDFILPGDLPKIIVDKKDPTKVAIDSDARIKYPINGKSFNLNDPPLTLKLENLKCKVPKTVGNLLNVFIKKDRFVEIFNKSYNFSDFYESILGMINDGLFGLCKLEVGTLSSEQNSALTIIDKKLRQQSTDTVKQLYRFKIDPLKSTLHELNFNVEMSNLMQAQALYESQLSLWEGTPKDLKGSGAAFKTERSHLKILGQTNLDNMYSVDWVGYQINKKSEGWQKKPKTDTAIDGKTPNNETAVDIKNLNSAIEQKFVRFKATSGDPQPLIYQDYTFIQSKVIEEFPSTSVLTYLECDITIDGLAGFRCGELFNIDGIPEIYNKNGAFQILNIKQSVQNDTGWRTTINAGFRYNVK